MTQEFLDVSRRSAEPATENFRSALTLTPALMVIALGLERGSSLPGNVCLTCSDGLLLGSRVACQFESHSLRRPVLSNRDSHQGRVHSALTLIARRSYSHLSAL